MSEISTKKNSLYKYARRTGTYKQKRWPKKKKKRAKMAGGGLQFPEFKLSFRITLPRPGLPDFS
jgi:hypothetical protein